LQRSPLSWSGAAGVWVLGGVRRARVHRLNLLGAFARHGPLLLLTVCVALGRTSFRSDRTHVAFPTIGSSPAANGQARSMFYAGTLPTEPQRERSSSELRRVTSRQVRASLSSSDGDRGTLNFDGEAVSGPGRCACSPALSTCFDDAKGGHHGRLQRTHDSTTPRGVSGCANRFARARHRVPVPQCWSCRSTTSSRPSPPPSLFSRRR
jgi:hypothetical protein